MIRSPRRLPALLVASGLLLAACSDSGGGGDEGEDAFGDPGDCIVVDLAVSSEKIALLSDLARQFNDDDNEVDGTCVFARPLKKASGGAMQLLAQGWGEDERLEESEGPAPVVWSPASSSWGAILDQRLAENGQAPMAGEGTPFMLTPLVIAMPQPMAEALGWPEADLGWADIVELARSEEGWSDFDHPEWGPFRLGKTNPNFSTSGLSALIAQLYASTGKTNGLSLEDLADPTVVDTARDVEASVVHYGDTTMTFLNNWYAADQRGTALTYASAAAVEEKSIIDYNQGNPDGELAPGEEPRPPRVPLVALYPTEGTLFSDNPFYILDAPWVDADERAGAQLFQDFVQRPENQERVLEFGFRPANPEVAIGAPVEAANKVDPDEPQTLLEVPAPEVMAEVLDFWDANRKGARVLLLIDVSGSMGELADDATGDTKLDLATRAAVASLDQFKADDLVGLRVFTTELSGGANWLDVVPPGPVADQRESLAEEIEKLTPLNGTPLYEATAEAFQDALDGYDPDRINAVVLLSDGRNDDFDPSDDRDDLEALLADMIAESESEVGRPVRVFPIAYGRDADLDTLRRIAEATNAAAYDASDPTSITKVFTAVVSNF